MIRVDGERSRLVLSLLLLIGTPCLAHLPELVGWKTCNPYFLISGLADWKGWIRGTCFVDGNVGNTVQALGGLSAAQWLDGRLPWWNHYAAAGLPLASTMQPGSFFLPFVLLLHLFDGPLALKLTMQCLSGLFTFAFLREAGLARMPSLLGGVLFSLNGSFAYFGDAPVFPIPFLPLLLLGITRCGRALDESRPGGPLLVAVAICYSLVSGFPETALMDGLFGLGWLALEAFRLRGRRAVRLCAAVCGGGIVGLLLAAPVLIPFLRELRSSSLGAHVMVSSNRFRADQLAGLLFPTLFGAPLEDGDVDGWGGIWGYVGVATTMLALVALAGARRDPRRLFAAGWIVFMVLAMCRVPGIDWIRNHLPLLGLVDFRRYPAASCEFAAILLAAFAVDDWRGGVPVRRRRGAALSFAVMALAFLALAWSHLVAEATRIASVRLDAILTLSTGSAIAAATLWLLGRPATRAAARGMLAIGLIDASISFMNPVLHGESRTTLDLAPIAYLQAHQGLFRLHALGARLVPNYAGLFGLASIDDIVTPVPTLWDRQATRMDPHLFGFLFVGEYDGDGRNLIARRTAFAEVGTRYVILAADHDPLAGQPGFQLAFDGVRTRIYEIAGAKPYFEIASGRCTLEVVDRDRLAARCDGPALLTRREMRFPGWHARIDGHETAIEAAPPIFQQIALPAGRSDIVWRYLPVDATAIALAFGGGVLALLALLAAAAWPVQAAGLRSRSANCLRNLATLGAITTRQ